MSPDVDAMTELSGKADAVRLEADESPNPSKNALKKAAKQQRAAEQKATKAAKGNQKGNNADGIKQHDKKTPSRLVEGAELKAITVKKQGDFARWYAQVLTKGGFISYTDISGCYVYRPASYAVWEEITKWFDAKIKSIGVKNCYFPMFATKEQLEREQNHVEGFAAEVAWVTKYGNSKLEKEIALRPTSETII